LCDGRQNDGRCEGEALAAAIGAWHSLFRSFSASEIISAFQRPERARATSAPAASYSQQRCLGSHRPPLL